MKDLLWSVFGLGVGVGILLFWLISGVIDSLERTLKRRAAQRR